MSGSRSRSPRPPAVAGGFYELDAGALHAQLKSCFTDPRGPGELPAHERAPERRIRALVVPHAGYRYSGPIAADAFAAIAAERPPATVLLLGVNHSGRGAPAALSDREWLTPLGPVAVDHDLVRSLAHPPLAIDEQAHVTEHSLEVELPFLQYVLPHPRIVALSVTYDRFEGLERVARVVRGAIRDRDVLLVASTDFSHYVPPEVARREDGYALEAIRSRSAEALYEVVNERRISMCGIAPTTVLLSVLEGEGLEARLLRWGHSGEAEPMREVVGYASFLFESTDGPLG